MDQRKDQGWGKSYRNNLRRDISPCTFEFAAARFNVFDINKVSSAVPLIVKFDLGGQQEFGTRRV